MINGRIWSQKRVVFGFSIIDCIIFLNLEHTFIIVSSNPKVFANWATLIKKGDKAEVTIVFLCIENSWKISTKRIKKWNWNSTNFVTIEILLHIIVLKYDKDAKPVQLKNTLLLFDKILRRPYAKVIASHENLSV